MVVEGENRFPKFERWLQKEYPSAYEEEIYHRSEWPIGILLTTFGFFPWVLSNFAFGPIQIVGLGASLFGIIVIIAGLVRYRLKLEHYRYHGLTRMTISDAIMSLDAHIVTPDEVELLAPYYEKPEPLRSERVAKRFALTKFIKNTAGLIEWPSDFIIHMKENLKHEEKQLRTFSISFVVFLLIPITMTYYFLTSGSFFFISLYFAPLAFCIAEVAYGYFRNLSNHSYLFRGNWLLDVVTSESVRLEETMVRILNLLHLEFQYPLRFYLSREYPLLTYTGRTKTTLTLARLKEAILYPG